MEKHYEKKITWTIKKFSSLQCTVLCSDPFVVGGCKWRLKVYPKGEDTTDNYLSLFIEVADSKSLPYGWKRRAEYSLTVVNQLSDELSKRRETHDWFDQKAPNIGYPRMLPLAKLHDKNGGFLVNDEVKIAAEVGVLKAIGESDVLDETTLVMETIDVNGFQVFPAQVKTVKSLFEKHPDIVSQFCPKNPHLRTKCLNDILSLTEILGNSPEGLSNGDLADAYSAVRYVTKAGFKLDWLEKNLKEVGKTRMKELEEEFKNLKQKHEDMDALIEFLR